MSVTAFIEKWCDITKHCLMWSEQQKSVAALKQMVYNMRCEYRFPYCCAIDSWSPVRNTFATSLHFSRSKNFEIVSDCDCQTCMGNFSHGTLLAEYIFLYRKWWVVNVHRVFALSHRTYVQCTSFIVHGMPSFGVCFVQWWLFACLFVVTSHMDTQCWCQ